MDRTGYNTNYISFTILTISLITTCLMFLWQGNKGFDLWDEGFLWYGTQRVLLGEVPFRDFMAYDPGRYYWAASILSLIGDNGIVGLRSTMAIFQSIGLFVGLHTVLQTKLTKKRPDILFGILSAMTLMVWMLPRHKLVDISLSIFLTGILAYLISNPIPKRYFHTGVAVGLIAVFGRNHGVYGAVSSLGVIVWLNINRTMGPPLLKGISHWAAGVTLGYLPIVFMLVFVPGFAVAFWESILFLFEQKTTNLALTIPWPWTVDFVSAQSTSAALRTFFIGTLLIALPAFGMISILYSLHRRWHGKATKPALVAAGFLALPYAHFAFSRADLGHVAQSIFPLLIGILTLASSANKTIKWPTSVSLLIISLWIVHPYHPGWQCKPNKNCIAVEVSGSELLVPAGSAENIKLLRTLEQRYAPNGESFIATPFWPGAYALLERKSPMWEIYALFPRTEAFEQQEIERIKISKPHFVIVNDYPLDDRDELRFKNTHPIIHKFILENFEPVLHFSNSEYQIYQAREKS